MLKKLALTALCASSALAMHIAEVNLNEKDIEASIQFDMGQFNETVEPGTTYLGARYVHASDEHSDTTRVGDMGQLFFLVKDHVAGGFSLGMGIKALQTRLHSYNFIAIPLGFEASYRIPGDTFVPMELGGLFYYSPQVLSLDDAQNYIEGRIYFDIELIERGTITLGYRHIDTNYEQGDVEYNHAGYVGFKFAF